MAVLALAGLKLLSVDPASAAVAQRHRDRLTVLAQSIHTSMVAYCQRLSGLCIRLVLPDFHYWRLRLNHMDWHRVVL